MDGLNFGGLLGGFGHGVGEDGDPANVRGATAEALGQFVGKALGEMVKPMVQDSVKTAVDLALREGFKQGVDEAYERMDLESDAAAAAGGAAAMGAEGGGGAAAAVPFHSRFKDDQHIDMMDDEIYLGGGEIEPYVAPGARR